MVMDPAETKYSSTVIMVIRIMLRLKTQVCSRNDDCLRVYRVNKSRFLAGSGFLIDDQKSHLNSMKRRAHEKRTKTPNFLVTV
jgi:hypothetical protein